MNRFTRLAGIAVLGALLPAASFAAPEYTSDNRLVIPPEYRTWVFLTSSLDLNYNDPVPGAGRQSLLDNVFVDPDAYKSFVATGIWPDKTVFVKENRVAATAGTISREGKYQTTVASIELHVKDEAKAEGKWLFFVSDGKNPGRPMPADAGCVSCHSAHGAVDQTFVQFYPTLLPIAKAKGTLAPAYVKEAATLPGAP